MRLILVGCEYMRLILVGCEYTGTTTLAEERVLLHLG